MKNVALLAGLLGGLAFAGAQAGSNGPVVSARNAARYDRLPEMISEAEKGVLFIRVLDPSGREISAGTGFLVDDQGTVLTCLHVLQGRSRAAVSSAEAVAADGTVLHIKGVVGSDESLDLVLLQLDGVPAGAVPLRFADERVPQRGEYVLVLGHPQGFRFVATDGILSAVHRTRELPAPFRDCDCVHAGPEAIWLQTSAAVSYGNSGGPMLDASGRVIGVIQWLAGGQGLNFALHGSSATNVLTGRRPLEPVEAFTRPETALQTALADFERDLSVYAGGLNPFFGEAWPGFGSRTGATTRVRTHPAPAYIPRLLTLAEENRGRAVEYRALEAAIKMACVQGCPSNVAADVIRTSERLVEAFRDDRRMLTLLRGQPRPSLPEARDFLRAVSSRSAQADIRALASLALARALEADADKQSAREEALRLARSAAGSDPGLTLGRETAAAVASNLIERLSVPMAGTRAPALAGTDQFGTPFRLADCTGRCVVVAFMAGGSNASDVPLGVLAMLARDHAQVPLPVVGVVTNGPWPFDGMSTGLLVRIVKDGPEGAIRKDWHVQTTPLAFLVDANGTILGRFEDKTTLTDLSFGSRSFRYSSSMNVGGWVTELKRAIAELPAIAGPRLRLLHAVTGGMWTVKGSWDSVAPGDASVRFRPGGRTSVGWITDWQLQTNRLHVHIPRTGCVEFDVDAARGEARVVSPTGLVGRALLRGADGIFTDETEAARTTRNLLLAERWDWFDTGRAGFVAPHATIRFASNGTTGVSWLPGWDVLPSGQVRITGLRQACWIFDVDGDAKLARSRIPDSPTRESKAFAVAGTMPPRVFDPSAAPVVCTGRFTAAGAWQEMRFPAVTGRYVCLQTLSSQSNDVWASAAELELVGPDGARLDRRNWSIAYVSSEEMQGENGRAVNLLDADPGTIWHTQWRMTTPGHPHAVLIDLGRRQPVAGLQMLPRSVVWNGRIKDFRIQVGQSLADFQRPAAAVPATSSGLPAPHTPPEIRDP